ncbi:unnamed protein product, partial [Bubo scandiacus]
VTGSNKLYGSSCGFRVSAVSPQSSHMLLCLLTCVCTGACVARPCEVKHWPQCKEQRRDKQARLGRRQRCH